MLSFGSFYTVKIMENNGIDAAEYLDGCIEIFLLNCDLFNCCAALLLMNGASQGMMNKESKAGSQNNQHNL